MNDTDLREMFRRREADVQAPLGSPPSLVRRTHRRQLLTAGGSTAFALVVVLGSIAGLRSLGSSDGSQPGDVGPTTKTVSGITITYPERWFAEDPVAIGIEPNDTPRTLPTLVLALTRDDAHIQGVLGCPRLANIPGQVLMTVQETPLALSGESSAPWPVPLRSLDLGGGELGGCYEGWTFMRASWTAAGRSFEARLGFATDATDVDRAALLDAFASMTFAPGSVAAGESVTLGSGTASGGGSWSLTATRDDNGIAWTLQTDNGGSGASPVAATPESPTVAVHRAGSGSSFAVAILPSDVRSVVVDIGGDIIGDIGLFPVPQRWGELSLAVIPLTGGGTGTIRFQDRDGNDLYPPQPISWAAGGEPPQSPTEGSTGHQLPWENLEGTITAMGTFVGADAVVLVLTNLSVAQVSISQDAIWDGGWMPASTGAGGEARLWVIEVPGAGKGTLLFNGQVSGEARWP